jgi:hypothetical protein
MKKFMIPCAALALLGLILIALPPPTAGNGPAIASSQEDDLILGRWRWTWAPKLNSSNCPGGTGTIAFTQGVNAEGNEFRKVLFNGHARTSEGPIAPLSKTGSWSYDGIESSTGLRMYTVTWSNDTDTVTLSKDGRRLEGRNASGECGLTGTR